MLKYEDAIKYKIGDVVTINFTPTGKTYPGYEKYNIPHNNLKCKIDNVDKHDAERPLRFEPIDPEINMCNRHYLPIEGVTIVNKFDMPEIEPGMWAVDTDGIYWLAVKTSRNSSHISWVKSTICSHDNDELFQSKITKLQDRDANGLSQIVIWDRNKQTKLKELQQKQQELAKELEALNQQIEALK